jgi:hypothetical protein
MTGNKGSMITVPGSMTTGSQANDRTLESGQTTQPMAAMSPPRGINEAPRGRCLRNRPMLIDQLPIIINPPIVPRTAKIVHRRKSIIESYFLNIGDPESPRDSRNAIRSSTSFSFSVSSSPVGIIDVFD